MRTPLLAALLLLVASSCSGNPKSLTDSGQTNLGSGDYKAALADFDKALEKLGADPKDHVLYLSAALGRCQALAHVDPKRAATDFIVLAKAQRADIHESDFSLIANELLKINSKESRMQAIDVVVAGNAMFPESTHLRGIGDAVANAAERAADPESLKYIKGLGYGGR